MNLVMAGLAGSQVCPQFTHRLRALGLRGSCYRGPDLRNCLSEQGTTLLFRTYSMDGITRFPVHQVRPPGILLNLRLDTDIAAPCSNGKADKRALRQMALNKLASETAIIIDEKENVPPSAVVSVNEKAISPAVYEELAQNILAPPPTYQGFSPAKDISASDMLRNLPVLGSMKFPSQQSSIASPSLIERGNAWDGYEDDELPNKTQGPTVRNLRHRIFTLYRRLFGVLFITNAAVFIATVVNRHMNAQKLGLIVVANLFCAILMRQDYVINIFFNVFCAVPTSSVASLILAECHALTSALSGGLWLFGGFVPACIISEDVSSFICVRGTLLTTL